MILGGNITKFQTHQVLLPKVGLHCFFGLMFREILILLIHYDGNKMYSWHAVNQGLS